MARGQRARRAAPPRPAPSSRPAPKSTQTPQNGNLRQTRLDFPRGRRQSPPKEHASSSRETLYISSDDSFDVNEDLEEDDEDDMDITVHYQLNGEGPAGQLGKRGRDNDQDDGRDKVSQPKRARIGRDAVASPGTPVRSSYQYSDEVEDGEIEDDWESDGSVDRTPIVPPKRQGPVRFEAPGE